MDFISRVLALLLFVSISSIASAADLPVGALGGWTYTSELNTARSHHGVTHYNGYAYAVGGNGESQPIGSDNGQPLKSVEFASIKADGTLGPWQETAALPKPVMDAGVIAYNGYIYVAGGADTLSGDPVNTVYYAAINKDGSLGNWQLTSPMIKGQARFNLEAFNGHLYAVAGGYGVTNKVEFVAINDDGSLSSWQPGPNLPQRLWGVGLAVVNDRLYALGGYSSSGAGNSVYYSDINENGSLAGWNRGASLPIDLWGMATAVSDLEIYVIGGAENGGQDGTPVAAENSSQVYVAEVQGDGTIRQWTRTNGLLSKSQALGGFGNGKHVYAVGGTTWGSSQEPVKTSQFATIEGPQNHIPRDPVISDISFGYYPGEAWNVTFKMLFNPNYSLVSEFGFEITPQGGGAPVTTIFSSSGHQYDDNTVHTVISKKLNVSPANTAPQKADSPFEMATIYDLKGYVKVGSQKFYSKSITYANISPLAVEYDSYSNGQLTFNFLFNASRILSSSFTSSNTYLYCGSTVTPHKINIISFVGQKREEIGGASYIGAQNTANISGLLSAGTKVACGVVYNPGGSDNIIVSDTKTEMTFVVP